MKIPETSPNVGAYYGNEENGQWQPNGVIIDSGVGGGVVGSGDAGLHRPPVYPVHHIPRGIPGYVMAGAYYPQTYATVPPVAPQQDEFADYMWMENEEEFDKQVMQELEEEALMEQCVEAMLEDEERERHHRPTANGHAHYPTTSNGSLSLEETVSRSTLNPLAAEFVPTRIRQAPSTTEEKSEVKEQPAEETQKTTEQQPVEVQQEVATTEVNKTETTTEETKTEVPSAIPTTEPPEVSAADVQPIDKTEKRKEKKDVKKPEAKKPLKVESKPKPKQQPLVAVKSEPKVVQMKKKEVKPVKSETKEEVDAEGVSPAEPQSASITSPATPPSEESAPTAAPAGPKPINYAAAAKANKPRKPSTPPAEQPKTAPAAPPAKTEKKADKKETKVKTEKVLPRKNSVK